MTRRRCHDAPLSAADGRRRGVAWCILACALTVTPLAASDEQVVLGSTIGSALVLPSAVVTGLPYSAEATTETRQDMPDGNALRRTTTSMLYRDSLGRTRREQQLGASGPLASLLGDLRIVVIDDPVAEVLWTLQPVGRTAMRVARPARTRQNAPPTASRTPAPGTRSESLGFQTIAGVQAEGTRTTLTIAAGAAGSDRPITITTDTWMAVELQMPVMTRYTDPRSGETVFTVTKITRSEPPADLFQVPADYRIAEPTAIDRR